MTDDPGAAAPAPTPDAEYYLDRYLGALDAGDRRSAVDVALEMYDHGASAEQVITDLLAHGLAQVGRDWEAGRSSIAMEHRATGITESALQSLMVAATATHRLPPEGSRGRSVVACSEGEWHALPARMMAEVLRLRGVDADLVGPSMPAEELAGFLGTRPPSVVVVACSLPQTLPGAWRAVTALRALRTTVVVGGRGFGAHGRWSEAVGADVWSPSFSAGADAVLAAMLLQQPPVRGSTVPAAREEEVRTLESFGDAIVERAVAEAVAAWPGALARDAAVRATREDLRASLRTVTAATLVDDPVLVTDFVAWFETVLRARDLPLSFVASAFDLLLHHLPRSLVVAHRMARAGLAACEAEPLPRT